MIAARVALALALLLGSGCAPAAAPIAPLAPVAKARASLPATFEQGLSTPARSCDGRLPGIFAFASGGSLTCADEHRSCRGALSIEVLNCTAESVSLDPVAILRPGQRSEARVEYVPDSPIALGDSFAFHPTVYQRGGYSIAIVVLRGDRTEPLPTIEVEVEDPALDRALAACTACNGRWGREGMLQIEGCNCRPRDAGKICHDGDECEGACLPDGVEVITKAHPLTCDRRGHCSVSMGSGRLVGHCSDRMAIFGCHSEIPRGASKEPPAWLPLRAPSICVD